MMHVGRYFTGAFLTAMTTSTLIEGDFGADVVVAKGSTATVTLEVEISTSFGTDTDDSTASNTVVGTGTVVVDSDTSPTTLSIPSLDFDLGSADFSYSFFCLPIIGCQNLNVSVSNFMIGLDAGGVSGPVKGGIASYPNAPFVSSFDYQVSGLADIVGSNVVPEIYPFSTAVGMTGPDLLISNIALEPITFEIPPEDLPTGIGPVIITANVDLDAATLSGLLVPNEPDCCPGDFNCDGQVDGADFGSILATWGACADCPEDLPLLVCDRRRIGQVLNNLVVNACQAMPDGGRLRVDVATCTYRPAAGATPCRGVSVSVRDEGCGIPADHLEHVFEPYFTTKEAGNGLGLTSAYWIMQRHEGLLEVESARGVGTLFRFTLPLAESPIAPAAPPASPERPRAARILVMDDEPMVRETLVAMLECLGHEVVETAEGEACLSTFTEAAEAGRPFDLVVIDLTIVGGRDGLWTIKHLRELDPAVPTVVASGYSNAPVVADHQRYGFSAVLPKPMTLEQLDALVGRLLESAPTLAG